MPLEELRVSGYRSLRELRLGLSGLNVITHSHVVSTLLRFFDEHEAAFRPIQFKEPAPAFLRLLLKAGFSIDRSGGFDDA